MIDVEMFYMARLLTHLFEGDPWKKFCTIETRKTRYSACHSDTQEVEGWVVRHGKSFLRHSCGPGGGVFWDTYPDNFQTPELALARLIDAPTPPTLLRYDKFEFDDEQLPEEVDLTGRYSANGDVKYLGVARRQPNGTFLCLADVLGALCVVEVKLSRDGKEESPPRRLSLKKETEQ